LQASLLRVLEERQFTPLGCSEVLPLHAQVVASTNLHFESAIQSGKFREDLYYRLNEVPILLPSLRERKEDIPLLIRHFLDRHKTQTNRVVEILPEALEKLISYDWPGNVRELAKVIHRALTTCQSQYLTPKHFDFLLSLNKNSKRVDGKSAYKEDPAIPTTSISGSYKERMNGYQKALLLSALEENGWNQTEAARRLGLSRAYFSRLVNALGLNRPES
jgi:two-component system nitrogen regulation response regulator NtrX